MDNRNLDRSLEIADLIAGYLNATLTEAEKKELSGWIDGDHHNRALFEQICNEQELININKTFKTYNTELAFEQIRSKMYSPRHKLARAFRLWKSIAAIAAVTLIVSGLYFYNRNFSIKQKEQDRAIKDIAPGKQGATLTLANGKKIRLSDAANGELAREAGVAISKTADGQVIYEIKKSGLNDHRVNMLSTKRGETYILTLPDQSKVWLNAASSLTYNASLNEHGMRVVKLIGEAYFEISKDKAHPFIVKTDRQEVEVLGTHFNINSYADEPTTKTTLLEGSVRISTTYHSQPILLKPGQLAINAGNNIKIQQADIELELAWKNGDFAFKGETLESVMRKVAKWYDVEIFYAANAPKDVHLEGVVSRKRNISAVLAKMEETGSVKFKIDGRKITISQPNQ